MDVMEQLRAWGAVHAQARRAEHAAQQSVESDLSAGLRQQATSLRQQADRLHREIYRNLDQPRRDTPP